jgi:hypothetical protein
MLGIVAIESGVATVAESFRIDRSTGFRPQRSQAKMSGYILDQNIVSVLSARNASPAGPELPSVASIRWLLRRLVKLGTKWVCVSIRLRDGGGGVRIWSMAMVRLSG